MRDLAPADPAAAFEASLAVRHRLPPAEFPRAYREAARLEEIVEPYDLVLLDAYGVLNIGETPIPGAVETIAALRRAGKAVMVVSNSAAYPKAHMMRRYVRMGFDFTPGEVVTSREALLAHLEREPRRHWGAMLGESHGLAEFEGQQVSILADDPGIYDKVEGFLMVGSDDWTEERQERLAHAIAARPRPVLVGNPDLVAPREHGLSLEPGHFAHRLAEETGVAPVFLGKPFPKIFELALARQCQHLRPERVLMVGDTLHTDVLGGRHMGFATALTAEHGSLAELDVADAITRASVVPDYVLSSV